MNMTVRPIGQWPGKETPAYRRRRSPFKTTHSRTMGLLERELRYLGAKQVVLEIDVRPQDLRLDGGLRSNARPQGPRVIVNADTRQGHLQIPCDTFDQYESNLYAIALTLEKLRAIDRYGVSMSGEQYTGWIALPSTTAATDPVEEAWQLLVREAGHAAVIVRNRGRLDELYRGAARRAHPDTGGTDARMTAVNRARDIIARSLGAM